MSKSNTVEVIL